jgi:hypothetical protein
MAKLRVEAGACGFTAILQVEEIEGHTLRVVITSDCEQLSAMNPDLASLQWRQGVFCRMDESLIYHIASRRISHTACPIPSAILKAIEVEVGLAPPKNVIMEFDTS